ncbi:MAG: family 20 glycosylhydrolase, partial [Lutimonas sp.]
VKMNVLHLHLTDHQGFRIESKVFPLLHEMGSEGNYYTQKEIREILEYASDRGIRIVPEFDVPGHTASWFPGYPELASDEGPHVLYKGVIGDAILNPANEYTFEFLKEFFGEMAALFPDVYFHVGADEPRDDDWNNNQEIQEFMNSKGFPDNHDLYAYFNQRLFEIVKGHGKRLLGWDEIRDAGLPSAEIGVQSWRNHKSLWKSAREGSHAILSAGYYLDHKQSAAFHYDVDPEVIKGAIEIEIDSTLWQSWKVDLNFNDTKLDGELFMFGANENRRGVMGIMGNLYGFNRVKEQDGTLEYDIEGPMGTATFELQQRGDSLQGESSISVFTLDITGSRSGGSDMPDGAPLPKFEKIEPLTEAQLNNLLGGEACMWTEAADSVTLESRIWPRSGAIAEKLWSPQELADDANDMYRRLLILNEQLETIGLRHRSYRDALVLNRVEDTYRKPLADLINVLQEDLLFNRLAIYDPPFDVDTPLNRVVDAAAPESYTAVGFDQKVDQWLESYDEALKEEIRVQLKTWATTYQKLRPAFDEHPFLQEVQPHAEHLSRLAELALSEIDKRGTASVSIKELDALLLDARKAYGGTLLSVESGLERLIKESGVEAEN